jgi:hypothetical protein
MLASLLAVATPGTTPQATPLDAIADIAIIVTAVIAAIAALIAANSFQSQKLTAETEKQLATEQLRLAELAENRSRDDTSMRLLLKFLDTWQSETFLRWRAQLAAGIEGKRTSGAPLNAYASLAFAEIGNLFEIVGFSVRSGLILERAAWEILSAPWEVYWDQNRDRENDPTGDPTSWSHAAWLMRRFREITETEGGLRADELEISAFLASEKRRAHLEEDVLTGPTPHSED